MSAKKIGRPTDNPKNTKITIRVDKGTLDILDNYCKKENLTRTEGIRNGIKKLEQ